MTAFSNKDHLYTQHLSRRAGPQTKGEAASAHLVVSNTRNQKSVFLCVFAVSAWSKHHGFGKHGVLACEYYFRSHCLWFKSYHASCQVTPKRQAALTVKRNAAAGKKPAGLSGRASASTAAKKRQRSEVRGSDDPVEECDAFMQEDFASADSDDEDPETSVKRMLSVRFSLSKQQELPLVVPPLHVHMPGVVA